jgi:hypothetical protein
MRRFAPDGWSTDAAESISNGQGLCQQVGVTQPFG